MQIIYEMKKLLFLPLCFTLLFSCNSKPEKNAEKRVEEKISEDKITEVKKHKECFALENGKDSVYLSITIAGDNSVSGDLVYNLYEKDRNRGELQGAFVGDSLFATYSFNSEGQRSSREVFFLKNGDQLTEGFGPITTEGNETKFNDHSTLKLNDIIKLNRVDCRD